MMQHLGIMRGVRVTVTPVFTDGTELIQLFHHLTHPILPHVLGRGHHYSAPPDGESTVSTWGQ